MRQIRYEEIEKFINGEEGNGCVLLTSREEFIKQKLMQKVSNANIKLKIQCKCGRGFYKAYNSFCSKNHLRKQCYYCGIKLRGKRKYDYKNEEMSLKKEGFEILKVEKLHKKYKNNRIAIFSFFHLLDKQGFKYKADVSCVRTCIKNKTFGFNKFHSSNPYTIDNIKLWLNKNNYQFELLDIQYIDSSTKMNWKCSKNHIFKTSLNKIQQGKGCPVCNESKGEKKIQNHLERQNIYYLHQEKFNDLRGIGNGQLSYDFYLPQYNLLIEYQGKFHDGTADLQNEKGFRIQQEHDRRKREYAKKHNINLLEIWYWDFDNIELIINKRINSNFKEAQ